MLKLKVFVDASSKREQPCVPGSINSHSFHIIGDKLINPIVGVYRAPLQGFPIKGGRSPIPNNIATG